jgi:hypothetical protein
MIQDCDIIAGGFEYTKQKPNTISLEPKSLRADARSSWGRFGANELPETAKEQFQTS